MILSATDQNEFFCQKSPFCRLWANYLTICVFLLMSSNVIPTHN
jgi:hypothetical protein